MVFPFSILIGEVTSWGDLYCEHYDSLEEMEQGHKRICENLEEYLKEEKD